MEDFAFLTAPEAPPLCPKTPWNREPSRRIEAAGLPPAVASALLLWNDDLDSSHTLSQGHLQPSCPFDPS